MSSGRSIELRKRFYLWMALLGVIGSGYALVITNPIQTPPAFFLYIPGPVSLNEDTSGVVDFFPTNTYGDSLSYTVQAAHGTVTGSGTEWTYVPNPNFFGVDTLSFTAYDAILNASVSSAVSMIVNPMPDPPVASFNLPAAVTFPGFTNPVVIASVCDAPAQLILDGSSSSDPDQDALAYAWLSETNYLGSGVTNAATLDVGIHTATLFVSDGTFTNAASVTFEIISPCTALANLEQIFNQAALPKKIHRRLRPMLTHAANQLAKGNIRKARNDLKDFHTKLVSRVEPLDSELAGQLEDVSQDILNALRDSRKR